MIFTFHTSLTLLFLRLVYVRTSRTLTLKMYKNAEYNLSENQQLNNKNI